jgi:hypothetical protein
MANDSTTPVVDTRKRGRLLVWTGVGLALLGIVLCIVQFSLKILYVPWYAPALATTGALLLLAAVAQRRGVIRIIALVLVAALAGLEWYFLGSLIKLPQYTGPAQAGKPIPSFRTILADGRPFTQQDLQTGQTTVLTFFRGRW